MGKQFSKQRMRWQEKRKSCFSLRILTNWRWRRRRKFNSGEERSLPVTGALLVTSGRTNIFPNLERTGKFQSQRERRPSWVLLNKHQYNQSFVISFFFILFMNQSVSNK